MSVFSLPFTFYRFPSNIINMCKKSRPIFLYFVTENMYFSPFIGKRGRRESFWKGLKTDVALKKRACPISGPISRAADDGEYVFTIFFSFGWMIVGGREKIAAVARSRAIIRRKIFFFSICQEEIKDDSSFFVFEWKGETSPRFPIFEILNGGVRTGKNRIIENVCQVFIRYFYMY